MPSTTKCKCNCQVVSMLSILDHSELRTACGVVCCVENECAVNEPLYKDQLSACAHFEHYNFFYNSDTVVSKYSVQLSTFLHDN